MEYPIAATTLTPTAQTVSKMDLVIVVRLEFEHLVTQDLDFFVFLVFSFIAVLPFLSAT